jgi:hypothetical protein
MPGSDLEPNRYYVGQKSGGGSPPLSSFLRESLYEEELMNKPVTTRKLEGRQGSLYLARREWKLGFATGGGQRARERTIRGRDLEANGTRSSGEEGVSGSGRSGLWRWRGGCWWSCGGTWRQEPFRRGRSRYVDA